MALEFSNNRDFIFQILSETEGGRSLPFSVKVGSVELFPYIFWGTISCVVLFGSRSLIQSVSGRKKSSGRWVYDRSLGGKKVKQ